MEDTFTEHFFAWADAQGISRDAIADATGNNPKTVSTWRSIGIPRGKQTACQFFMEQHTRAAQLEELRGKMLLRPTHEQFNRWNRAALREGKTIEDWAFEGLERMAEEYFATSGKAKPTAKSDVPGASHSGSSGKQAGER